MSDFDRIVEQLKPLVAQLAVIAITLLLLGLAYLLVIRSLKTLQ